MGNLEWHRVARVFPGLWIVLGALVLMGLVVLYSASGASLTPWVTRQAVHLFLGILLMLLVMAVPLRLVFEASYLFYAAGLVLLVIVECIGMIGKGGQRWIDLGIMRLQPSEMMKIALILAMGRYLAVQDQAFWKRPGTWLVSLGMLGFPVLLIMKQPDLGTALFLLGGGCSMLVVAGLPLWFMIATSVTAGCSAPFLWSLMHDYQKKRILTFLAPENDPLGASYHIRQAMIALGSGGFAGKGLTEGTQSRLNFLPEKHTDSIFSVIGEEWGFLGSVVVLLFYMALLVYAFRVVFQSRDFFSRFVALGLTSMVFLYVFINTAMIMGLMPMVGVPLPLMSYGGSASLTFLLMLGLLANLETSETIRHCR